MPRAPAARAGSYHEAKERRATLVSRRSRFAAFEDKTLVCRECGGEFVLTEGEQEFYQRKGLLNEPTRCGACRSERKRMRSNFDMAGPRTLYPAVCAACGRETEVPFEPRLGRPVYCRDCFSSMRS